MSKNMKRTIDERDSEVPRRGRRELGKDWRTKNRKCIRCKNARDDKRTGSPTENHSFTERKPIQRKNSRMNKVEIQDITRKFHVVNHVDKKNWSGTQNSWRRWSSSTRRVRPHRT